MLTFRTKTPAELAATGWRQAGERWVPPADCEHTAWLTDHMRTVGVQADALPGTDAWHGQAADGCRGPNNLPYTWHLDMLAAVRLRTVDELTAAGYRVEQRTGAFTSIDVWTSAGVCVVATTLAPGNTGPRLGCWVPADYAFAGCALNNDAAAARRALVAESTVHLPDLPHVPVRGSVGGAPGAGAPVAVPLSFPLQCGDIWVDRRGVRVVVRVARPDSNFDTVDAGHPYQIGVHLPDGRIKGGISQYDLVTLVERAGRVVEQAPVAPTEPPLVSPTESPLTYGPTGPTLSARQRIELFRDAPIEDALNRVRAGFELETQATEGMTRDDGGLNQDAYDEARGDWVSRQISRTPSCVWDALDERAQERVRESLWDDASDHVDVSDYRRDADDVCSEVQEQLGSRLLEVVEDSTVDGVEIRTRGGLTAAEYQTAARQAFSLDHEIDEQCSFHVHVSLPGVKHFWGERMQLALTEYLVRHADRAPARVRDRWASTRQRNEYFKPGVGHADKYWFVHAHEQGTWEFRCFGNVTNTADADRCLRLAVEALQYAYGATTGRVQLLADQWGLTHEGFAELAAEALDHGRTLVEQYEASNADRYQRAA